MRRRRSPEIIAGKVNADGSINNAGTGDWTVQRISAGRYLVTGPAGFRCFSAAGNQINATVAISVVVVTTPSAQTQEFWTLNTAAANTDYGFAFVMVGVQQ